MLIQANAAGQFYNSDHVVGIVTGGATGGQQVKLILSSGDIAAVGSVFAQASDAEDAAERLAHAVDRVHVAE